MPERRHDLLERLTKQIPLRGGQETLQRVRGIRMDAFSEILSGVKLNGALFFSAEFSAPWGISSPASKTMAAMLAPGAAHLVLYHFVIDGRALVGWRMGNPSSWSPATSSSFPTAIRTK